jgi:O-acetylhomoserine (thiol)-lyase
MSDEDLKKAGITAGTVRLSIGLEDCQDLLDDLDRALATARRAAT